MITAINQTEKRTSLSSLMALKGVLKDKSKQSKKILSQIGENKKRVLQLRDILFLLKKRKDTSEWAGRYLTENDIIIQDIESIEREITKNFREISDLLLAWEMDKRLKFLSVTKRIKLSLLGVAFWDFITSYENKVSAVKITALDISRKAIKMKKRVEKYDKKIQKLGTGKVPTTVKQILEGYKTVVVSPLRWAGLIVAGIAAIYLVPKILPSK